MNRGFDENGKAEAREMDGSWRFDSVLFRRIFELVFIPFISESDCYY